MFGEPYHLQETISANQTWCIKSPYNTLLNPTKLRPNPLIREVMDLQRKNAKYRIDLKTLN